MAKSKLNPENEDLKEKYEKYLKNFRTIKLVDDSVKNKLTSINKFDEFCNYTNFSDFNADKGIAFYESLKNEDIELSTVFKHLNNVQEFLKWYFTNSKIKNHKHLIASLSVFEPTEEDKRLAKRLTYVEYPTLAEFEKIIDFEETSITDKRDKAILAFLYISCARINAVATATLNLIDLKKMIFKQDPLEGVKTKRQKHIITKLMPFDEKYFDILKNWVEYLKQEQSFKDNDPLFPKIKTYNKVEKIETKFMDGEGEYNKMLEKRCINAGCQKYNPHAFRHFGIHEALKKVRTGTQLKALSQNVGHEDITTILEQYAKMKPEIYMSVVDNMIRVKANNRIIDDMTNEEILDFLKQRLSVENMF